MSARSVEGISGFQPLDLGDDWADARLSSWFERTGNEKCFECGFDVLPPHLWVSVTYAISLCENCAGMHRGLGTHLSVVKSPLLDRWTDAELERLECGGNLQCSGALKGRYVRNSQRTPPLVNLCSRYNSIEAAEHRAALDPSHSQEQFDIRAAFAPLTASASPAASHAMALAGRPGYFHTDGGFGYFDPALLLRNERGILFRSVSLLKQSWMRCAAPTHEAPTDNIFLCAEHGNLEGLHWCLDTGASSQDYDDLGWTPLFYAAKFGKAQACKLLLSSAEAPRLVANTCERSGLKRTPLHFAAELGHTACVDVLLEFGAEPNGCVSKVRRSLTSAVRTPLDLAIFTRKQGAVDLLLGFGADASRCGTTIASQAATCYKTFSWRRRRAFYLIRDKAMPASENEYALQKLLRERPLICFAIASHL